MIHIPPLDEPRTQAYVSGYSAADKLRDLGNGYALHRGRYSLRHAHHEKRHGPLIVVLHDKCVVGACREEFFWVHPKHRQRGLASEMHLEFIAGSNPVVIEHGGHRLAVTRKFAAHAGRRLTVKGALMARHTYKVLVERGVLV